MASALTENALRGQVDIQAVGHDRWVMRLRGEHDLATLDLIEASFDAVGEPFELVVVDLTEAQFVEAVIIGAILKHRNAGRNLRVLLPTTGMVNRLAELLELETRIPVYRSLHEALTD